VRPRRSGLARKLARACVGLYPPVWRRRYASELLAIVEAHHVTLRTLLDLLGGALDARIFYSTSSPKMSPGLRRLVSATAILAYFVAYYAWFTVDEPLPSERLYRAPVLWRQTEGLMNLSIEVVYFGLIGLSLLVGSATVLRAWRARHVVWAVSTSLPTAVSGLCGTAVLAGAAVVAAGAGPLSPVLFLCLLIGGMVSSLASIALASPPIRSGTWRRLGIIFLSLGVTSGMALALAATIVFAWDLTTNGVPIISSAGQVTIYGAAAVPTEGWGYSLRPTGSWLGNLGASVGLAVLATVMSVAALRGTQRLNLPASVD